MGKKSRSRGGSTAFADQAPTVMLDELFRDHNVEGIVRNSAGDPVIITSPRLDELPDPGRRVLAEKVDMSEIGSVSPSPFTKDFRSEYNRDLMGIEGLKKYDIMRKSDATCRGTLRLVKTPVLAARWFMEPASDSKRDENAAEFIWKCFTEYMTISWPQILTEALLMMDFGYYMMEIVWEEKTIEGKDRLIWKKLAPRHPMDVKEWKFDKNGGPEGVYVYVDEDGKYGYDERWIPIDKLLVFTFDREAGDIAGISVLRSAYKHWYYKEQLYKIDAIQKERHGIGVPVIQLPVGFKEEDRRLAEDMGRNLRTNERAHIVLPPNWTLIFAKLEGNPVNAMESIEHHNAQIRENILATFLGESSATKEEDQTMFLKATRFVADVVCETFNIYGIPKLMKYNFERTGTPKLKARRIGEQADWRTISFALRNLAGAGFLRPDDRLEDWLRDEMDLPRADIATTRVVNTPQAAQTPPPTTPNATPGTQGAPQSGQNTNMNKNIVGMPRQSPVAPVGVPSAGAGVDRSGRA